MGDIKRMATSKNMGDNHTQIWPDVKKAAKPVLANWFAEHFPSPDLWYEARVNFAKTCAIWSIIGYVIGLGDRHGDNILVH
jgi:phosphatidylinositol kinase/protein kinase (PI-3  family)